MTKTITFLHNGMEYRTNPDASIVEHHDGTRWNRTHSLDVRTAALVAAGPRGKGNLQAVPERKKTAAQLDAEISDILAGPTSGPGSELKPGTSVTCSYRGDHVGKVLAIDDPRAWANTGAFPQDKPDRREIKEHILRHPTIATTSIPVLYPHGVQWDRRDSLTPTTRSRAARRKQVT